MYKRLELPNRLFTVEVPMVVTIPDLELEMFGTPIDMINGKKNPKTHLETSRVMLPVARIIEIYSSGHKIMMPIREEISELYKVMDVFLTRIVEANQLSLNKVDIDEHLVEEIDKFCTEMFSFNRNTILKGQLDVNKSSGYNLGVELMTLKHVGHTPRQQVQPDIQSYQRNSVFDMIPDQPQEVTYIFGQGPKIAVDTIKRESILKHLHQG